MNNMVIEFDGFMYNGFQVTEDFKLPDELVTNFGYEAKFRDDMLEISLLEDVHESGKIGDYFIYHTCTDSDGEHYCAFYILDKNELNKSFKIME